ncbi:MAG: TRAP transporter TatT component family protein [Oligoflexia bacterium]|nr:TRAP transporter TatT component family protein [Oligoflexia bacterium]
MRTVLLAFLLACAGTSHAAPLPPRSALSPETARADQAFRERRKDARAREALERYRALHFRKPEDPELGWRFAMACYFVGRRLTGENDERIRLFAEGRDAGKAALKAAPRCAPCHFWTAINMALYGQAVGPLKTLFSLKEIRSHLESTIRLEPTYAFAGAQRLLGLIEQELPGILGGSNDRARTHFEEALAAAPEEPMNYLFLARLLDSEFDEKARAQALARAGMELPIADPARVESLEARQTLQEFVKTGKWKYN